MHFCDFSPSLSPFVIHSFVKWWQRAFFKLFLFPQPPPLTSSFLFFYPFFFPALSLSDSLSIHSCLAFSLLPHHSLPLFLYLSVSSAGGLTNYSPLFLFPSLLLWHSAEDTWLNPAGHLCVHLFSLSLHPSLCSAPNLLLCCLILPLEQIYVLLFIL